ncbi:unnamed protein product [Callosobruchus maculatus]|uniref:EF-hand domain-containing protein n=1 Tax=Callosobruchus maculatus TaxID=64391 RepID=A0A653DEL7_CALMS|nr:unnamed protein product [Callosobruchus maculatus]
MASSKILLRSIFPRGILQKQFSTFNKTRIQKQRQLPILGLLGGSVIVYTVYKYRSHQVYAAQFKNEDDSRVVKLTSREKRFIRFASVQYDGQLYMTPQDFLESVIEPDPRQAIKSSTPPLSQGSPRLFRSLRDNGIVSYTEYLFMLSVLTKPQSGFRIAFNMFDTDGNERVDKNEFLVIQTLLAGKKIDDDFPPCMER